MSAMATETHAPLIEDPNGGPPMRPCFSPLNGDSCRTADDSSVFQPVFQTGRTYACSGQCNARQRLDSQSSGVRHLNGIAEYHACPGSTGDCGDCRGCCRGEAIQYVARNNNDSLATFKGCGTRCGVQNGVINFQPDRTRSKSESTRDSGIDSDRYYRNPVASYRPPSNREVIMMETGGKPKRRIRCQRKTACMIFVVIISLLSLVGAGLAYFRMKQMEQQIYKLGESTEKENSPSQGSVEMIRSIERPPGSRPHAHLSLKLDGGVIPLTPWKQRVLQWKPETESAGGGDSSLRYDSERRSLIVQESGAYFLYNQIYVIRHLTNSGRGLNTMKNQTLFHTIYHRPFNFRLDREPMKISQSTLSNCWNKNANTQVHTSYQGLVYHLQANDEILVALQDYDANIDTLVPHSTFLGAFKL